MGFKKLEDVTGLGKTIIHRDKYTHDCFEVGTIEDEVSVSDGEQKYFLQLVRLVDDLSCEGDPTRHVVRVGYYTNRADGRFCLGSQFAPMFTPSELRCLITAMEQKQWSIKK